MRVDGQWEGCPDGGKRATLVAFVQATTGEWIDRTFMPDTGADNTVLTAELVQELQIPTQPPRFKVGGIGGRANIVQVKPAFRFLRDGGGFVTLNVECFALTDPRTLDEPVLGRDILNLFALILDPAADRVCLLHGNHSYVIQKA